MAMFFDIPCALSYHFSSLLLCLVLVGTTTTDASSSSTATNPSFGFQPIKFGSSVFAGNDGRPTILALGRPQVGKSRILNILNAETSAEFEKLLNDDDEDADFDDAFLESSDVGDFKHMRLMNIRCVSGELSRDALQRSGLRDNHQFRQFHLCEAPAIDAHHHNRRDLIDLAIQKTIEMTGNVAKVLYVTAPINYAGSNSKLQSEFIREVFDATASVRDVLQILVSHQDVIRDDDDEESTRRDRRRRSMAQKKQEESNRLMESGASAKAIVESMCNTYPELWRNPDDDEKQLVQRVIGFGAKNTEKVVGSFIQWVTQPDRPRLRRPPHISIPTALVIGAISCGKSTICNRVLQAFDADVKSELTFESGYDIKSQDFIDEGLFEMGRGFNDPKNNLYGFTQTVRCEVIAVNGSKMRLCDMPGLRYVHGTQDNTFIEDNIHLLENSLRTIYKQHRATVNQAFVVVAAYDLGDMAETVVRKYYAPALEVLKAFNIESKQFVLTMPEDSAASQEESLQFRQELSSALMKVSGVLCPEDSIAVSPMGEWNSDVNPNDDVFKAVQKFLQSPPAFPAMPHPQDHRWTLYSETKSHASRHGITLPSQSQHSTYDDVAPSENNAGRSFLSAIWAECTPSNMGSFALKVLVPIAISVAAQALSQSNSHTPTTNSDGVSSSNDGGNGEPTETASTALLVAMIGIAIGVLTIVVLCSWVLYRRRLRKKTGGEDKL